MTWVDALPPHHVVEVVCRCPDPDQCATSDLAAHRDRAWKEFFRVRAELERYRAAERVLRTTWGQGLEVLRQA